MNEKEDGPDVLITTLPYLHLYATITNKVNDGKIAVIIAATSNPVHLKTIFSLTITII